MILINLFANVPVFVLILSQVGEVIHLFNDLKLEGILLDHLTSHNLLQINHPKHPRLLQPINISKNLEVSFQEIWVFSCSTHDLSNELSELELVSNLGPIFVSPEFSHYSLLFLLLLIKLIVHGLFKIEQEWVELHEVIVFLNLGFGVLSIHLNILLFTTFAIKYLLVSSLALLSGSPMKMMVVPLKVVLFASFIVHLLHVLLVFFKEWILQCKLDELILSDWCNLSILTEGPEREDGLLA